ncbi:galactose-3-O-sulfotransferase 2-like [Discoglossus pictus]
MDLREDSAKTAAKEVRVTCHPHNHIFFLKTHKSASSTVMNILFRFGEYHNLTFAFPIKEDSQFMYPQFFSSRFVEGYSPNSSEMFNIMCHHMRFHLAEVEKVMPKDTFYFTIMRNPVSLMESAFSYFKYSDAFSKAKDLEDFLNNNSTFYVPKRSTNNFAKNLVTFDLGFDHNGLDTVKHFQLAWRTVEATFDLVMITEYFDESLVLLKDALCWSLDDVLSIPLNIRNYTSKFSINQETQERIKNWNKMDWQLYVYFNNSFWNRVERFGRKRMQSEVEELRRKRAQLVESCFHHEFLVEADKLHDKSLKPYQSGIAKILGYNLKPGLEKAEKLLCQRIVTPELQYHYLLHQKQKIKKLEG